MINDQRSYIVLCEAVIRSLSAERDDLLREKLAPGSTADTVTLPAVTEPAPPVLPILRRATGPIPIVLPNGIVMRAEPGGRRPSWAQQD